MTTNQLVYGIKKRTYQESLFYSCKLNEFDGIITDVEIRNNNKIVRLKITIHICRYYLKNIDGK